MTRFAAFFGLFAIIAGLLSGAWFAYSGRSSDQFADCRTSRVAGGAKLGGPFKLTNQAGVSVTDKQVIDRLSLVYFGYTYCPDVCPLDTTRNADVARTLNDRGIDLKPVFISFDPERDTPGALREFAAWIDPTLVALSGTLEETAAVAKAYGVYYAKTGEGEDYLMEHSTQSYLMHPKYGFLEFFPRAVRADQMSNVIACFSAKL